MELFEYILIALVCPLVLPFIEPKDSEDKVESEEEFIKIWR